MLFPIAIVFLVTWALGLLGVYRAGQLMHVFLLVGLMLLLVAFLRARDAAARRLANGSPASAGDRPEAR